VKAPADETGAVGEGEKEVIMLFLTYLGTLVKFYLLQYLIDDLHFDPGLSLALDRLLVALEAMP